MGYAILQKNVKLKFNVSTAICRASGGVCDISEKMYRSSAACPTDEFNASTTLCRNNVSECDAKEFCIGTANCQADINKSNGDFCLEGFANLENAKQAAQMILDAILQAYSVWKYSLQLHKRYGWVFR